MRAYTAGIQEFLATITLPVISVSDPDPGGFKRAKMKETTQTKDR
jgi:hypothetical protein